MCRGNLVQMHDAADLLRNFLSKHPFVRFIRLQWVDLSGILHTRIVPIAHAARLAAGSSIYTVGPACMTTPVCSEEPGDDTASHSVELRPDWTSLRHCNFARKHASVMCFVWCEEDENPSALCTRRLLKDTIVEDGPEEKHRSFLVGAEIEFVLLDSDLQAYSPLDAVEGWSQTGGLRGKVLTLLEEIVENLTTSGVGVWHFHTELARQLEIALEPLPPLQAIDALYFAIETIKHVAVAHDLRATLTPKPLLNGIINGMHLHLSMQPKTHSEHFLAGLLQYMQSILVLGITNYDGYARVGGGGDRLGAWVAWGTTNGEVPIGLISEAHWELRFPEATANQYLLLATVIRLGQMGIREQRPLVWKDLRTSSADLTQEQLRDLGVTQRLPRSLEQALEYFRNEAIFDTVMGTQMKSCYMSIKKRDLLAFQEMNEEERRRWFIRFF